MTRQQETIALENISCHGCVWEIQVSLEELHGFQSMEYDLTAKTVTVEYDPTQLSRQAIEAKIVAAGFRLKNNERESVNVNV